MTPDHDYSTAMGHGGVNGGTTWLHNIADALRAEGHEANIKSITQYVEDGTDYVIVQSESMMNCLHLHNYIGRGGKVIVLLGHFAPHKDYLPIVELRVQGRYFLSPWEGELLVEIGRPVHLFPHAYADLIDDKTSVNRQGSIVFAGNTYNLRSEDWFEGIDVTRIYGVLPKNMPAIYRGADVCLNLHGDFQKNIVSDEHNRLSRQPGMMINERHWSVLGAGGLLITDWIPQMERWFDRDELIAADTAQEYRELVEYYKNHKEEGLKKLAPAIKKVRENHTYSHRIKDLLKIVC